MNKNEFVKSVAAKAGLSKVDTTKVIDAFTEVVTEALSKGEDVRLVGFGTFDVSRREARKGRNPRTGELMNIAAFNQPKFRVGKQLKDAVNK